MTSMDEDNRRDMAELRRINELRRQIDAFLSDPGRANLSTQRALEAASAALRRASEHIQAVWN